MLYGLSINLTAPVQQRYGSLPVVARILALAVVWTAPAGLAGLRSSHLAAASTIATVALGVIGTGIAFVVMASLVGSVGATRSSVINYAIPVVALGLGVTFRGDQVALLAVTGVALVIAGALLASRSETTRPGSTHQR